MRYRKPSPKTLLGVTKWKKRIKKALGITAVMKPFRLIGNLKRRILRQAGYYTPQMKAVRAIQKGQVAGPLGPIQVSKRGDKGAEADGSGVLMAAMLSKQANGEHQPGEHAPENKALLMAAALSQGHAKDDEGGSGLGQALLLAAAMGGSDEKRPPVAKKRSRAKASQEGATKQEESPSPKAAPKRPRK
jgi:hypothetical protein